MNIPSTALLTGAAIALALAGCQERPAGTAPSAPPAAASAPAPSPPPATDQWTGKWNGPEGTFLQLTGSHGQYEVTIQNLDGPRTFAGTAMGDRIEFERNGTKESVHASNGAETGMKWLADKKDCLTVRTGEGYCRD